MAKLNEIICAALVMIVPILVVSNCQKQEGATEQVVKNLDKAMASVGERMEVTADQTKDVTKNKQQ